MLSIFPDLLTYSLIAPFLIRATIGIYALLSGSALLREKPIAGKRTRKNESIKRRIIGAASIIGGISLFVGFLTQLGALLLALIFAFRAYDEPRQRIIFIVLALIALSLLFSGPGFLAFDLPL